MCWQMIVIYIDKDKGRIGFTLQRIWKLYKLYEMWSTIAGWNRGEKGVDKEVINMQNISKKIRNTICNKSEFKTWLMPGFVI